MHHQNQLVWQKQQKSKRAMGCTEDTLLGTLNEKCGREGGTPIPDSNHRTSNPMKYWWTGWHEFQLWLFDMIISEMESTISSQAWRWRKKMKDDWHAIWKTRNFLMLWGHTHNANLNLCWVRGHAALLNMLGRATVPSCIPVGMISSLYLGFQMEVNVFTHE